MALMPRYARKGGLICDLNGVPNVLRPALGTPSGEAFHVVGPTYVHGFIDGQIIKIRDDDLLQERRFILA
jgi:hypothetical protein